MKYLYPYASEKCDLVDLRAAYEAGNLTKKKCQGCFSEPVIHSSLSVRVYGYDCGYDSKQVIHVEQASAPHLTVSKQRVNSMSHLETDKHTHTHCISQLPAASLWVTADDSKLIFPNFWDSVTTWESSFSDFTQDHVAAVFVVVNPPNSSAPTVSAYSLLMIQNRN